MTIQNEERRLYPVFFVIVLAVIAAFTGSAWAYEGMATPKLHVEGRFLKDPSGKNVLLHGWMQPTSSWFNGQGRWYSDPSDWTNPSNVAGLLNYLCDAATLMSDVDTPRYGRDHGWYCSFVRVNTDSIGGWTSEQGLVNSSQFNGWIQNFVVPYADHLRSCGLYLVLSATGPINTPNNGTHNAGVVEQQRLITFWQTVANAPGVKSADNIMFELMNEPVDIESYPGNGDWGNHAPQYFQAFREWIQPVINAVRNTGADNVIWVPTLEWQGSPHQHAQYPFTGTNCGVAAHYYPAYGGVRDDATAVQNLWNSQYKPAADLWPMIITEMSWFETPGDPWSLVYGHTWGFGNAVKNAIDNQGNVSYIVGFLGDLLDNLNDNLPVNCELSSNECAPAYFDWLPTYAWAAPGDGGVSVPANTWFRLTPRHATNKCLEVAGGGTGNGSNVQIWGDFDYECQQWRFEDVGDGYYRITPRHATGKCLDVSGVSYDNGATLHIWDYLGGQNQQWAFYDAGGGYYSIRARHSGKCVDVEGGSTADGADVLQWDYLGGSNQQWSLTPVANGLASGVYHIVARHSGKAIDAYNFGTSNGTPLVQWPYWGGENQQWVVTDEGNNEYSIIGLQSGRCIEVANWGMTDGSAVQLWDYWGQTNQKYYLTPTDSGYYRISPTHAPNSCLDVDGISSDDGALIHLWIWLGGNNQQWAFQSL